VNRSDLEAGFDTQFKRLAEGLPLPVPNHKFDKKRRWQIDRAWPDVKVGVELEGGAHGRMVICHSCNQPVRARKADGTPGKVVMVSGWHAHPNRFIGDKEKYNALTVAGWKLLRFTNDDVIADPFSMVETIRAVLESRINFRKLVDYLDRSDRDVLLLIAAGFNSNEIAARLDRGKVAVRRQIQDISEKLDARTRAAAVARAIAWKIILPGDIPFPTQ